MPNKTNRAVGLVAALAATASLAGAGAASAAVTKTTITAPTAGFSYTDQDVPGSQTFTVSGASNGTTGDQVALLCTYNDGDYNYLNGGNPVDVNADGSFTADVDRPEQQTCVVRAVPANNFNSDSFAAFPGPTHGFGYTYNNLNTNNPEGASQTDFNVESSTLRTRNYLESISGCGLDDNELYDAGFGDHNGTWDCDAYLPPNQSPVQTGSMVVDGHPVLVGGSASYTNDSVTGIPQQTSDKKFDAATGQWTIDETDGVVFCAAADNSIVDFTDYPVGQCDHYTPAPVKIQRTTTETDAGRTVSFVDSYASTDGAQHAVTSYYENDINGDTVQFPGEADMESHGSGAVVDLSGSSMGSIYTQEDRRYLPGTKNTQGAITYTSAPTRAIFGSEDYFLLQYDRTVPATGSAMISQTYSAAFTRDELETQTRKLEDGAAAPTVAFTSPAAGTVVPSDAVSVTGTAKDNAAVASLKVNGLPTTINPDGTWTQRVSLTPGANVVTAVATDESGNASQAQLSVVSSPVANASACVVPAVKGLTRAAATTALTGAGCSVGTVVSVPSKKVAKGKVVSQGNAVQSKVPAFFPVSLKLSSGKPGSAKVAKKTARLAGRSAKIAVKCAATAGSKCRAKLTLRTASGRYLGARTVTVSQGKRKTFSIRLSRRNAHKLHKAGKTKIKVSVAGRDGGKKSKSTVSLKG